MARTRRNEPGKQGGDREGKPLLIGLAWATVALGQNRGGVDLGGVAESAGEAKLSVTNTSNIKVKVLLNLGIVPQGG